FNSSISTGGTRGVVTLSSGILNFAVTGTSSVDGAWTNNGTLTFSVGTYNIGVTGQNNTFSLTGAGSSEITEATWNVLETCSVTTRVFQLTSGIVKGVGYLTVNAPGGFFWSGGSIQGPGVTAIPHSVTLTMSNTVSLSGGVISNSGKALISTQGAKLLLAGAT